MSTFKINLKKVFEDLKNADENFKKMTFAKEVTGLSYPSVMIWENEAPDVVELIYWNAKTFNHQFLEMIDYKSDLFPVFKLLKCYSEKTGNSIESVIIEI